MNYQTAEGLFALVLPCNEARSENSTNVVQMEAKYVVLCDEFADMFAEPGEPILRPLDHAIKWVDEAALPPR